MELRSDRKNCQTLSNRNYIQIRYSNPDEALNTLGIFLTDFTKEAFLNVPQSRAELLTASPKRLRSKLPVLSKNDLLNKRF